MQETQIIPHIRSMNFRSKFVEISDHLSKSKSRRCQGKNSDKQVIHKFGKFLDFRNHILIGKRNYTNNDKFPIETTFTCITE